MQLEHGPKAGAWAPAFFTDHEHGREHECAHIGTRLVQNARTHVMSGWRKAEARQFAAQLSMRSWSTAQKQGRGRQHSSRIMSTDASMSAHILARALSKMPVLTS
jgi:hypothetical protein